MNNADDILFKTLSDLNIFLSDIVLVGGWVPYIYKNFVWSDVAVSPHYTTDIDFGVYGHKGKLPGKTIYEHLAKLKYSERHIQMDKLFPIEFLARVDKKTFPVPVEFICDDKALLANIQRLVGREININQVAHFSILLSDIQMVSIERKNIAVKLNIPSEPIFIFHKLLTFPLRENTQKMGKDLYYAYYMLRFSPNAEKITAAFNDYRKLPEWRIVLKNLDGYFKSSSSKGVLWVEKEFGTDSIIEDLRQNIWEIFTVFSDA